MIYEGDCVEVMAGLEECSVSAIVTDPPYDLLSSSRNGSRRINNPDTPAGRSARGFMGKTWDGTGVAFCVQTWIQALRVAKPGAHLLAFGGTRTYHRLVCAIEDAGWEIRDCLVWAYATGFPKSLNLPGGLGTALKPAWEPIVLARRPLRGTVAANVAFYGTGALNIDGTRIGHNGRRDPAGADGLIHRTTGSVYGVATTGETFDTSLGRWPANVILTDPIFDGDTPGVVGGGETSSGSRSGVYSGGGYHGDWPDVSAAIDGDSGTYSRFFLIPKADRADREPVLGGLGTSRWNDGRVQPDKDYPSHRGATERQNSHPTVKPVELMRHLIRLVTPPGGIVLDPFLGSGTTAIAAEMEGFPWIGIEKEPEYVAIARARLNGTQRGLGLVG